MRMTRIWMTGCMALVLLAASRMPVRGDVEADKRNEHTRITMTSKYDLDETLRQVEHSLRRNGLPVVARAVPATQGGHDASEDAAHVLVLGDGGGLTPVMQAEGGVPPVLPWQVLIRQRADGQTEVSLLDPQTITLPDGIEAAAVRKVTALPELLKFALT